MFMPNIELQNIDCMELMAQYPDEYFDLAIVDPPYGIGWDRENLSMVNSASAKWRNPKGSGYEKKNWDKSIPNKAYFDELFRVSKNQIIFGGNYFSQYLPPSPCWIFWDKDNGDFSLADGELAWGSFDKALRKVKYTWHGFRKCEKGKRMHPTQKPIKLYEWILRNYAKEGDKILDTHGGSFNSAKAAYNLGFDFVGCEIDKDYYDKAMDSFKIHSSQLLITL